MAPPNPASSSPFVLLPPELQPVLARLKEIAYPVQSKQDLVAKLGGFDAKVDYLGKPAFVGPMTMLLPANYFPIASADNFAEKISDYYHLSHGGETRTQPATSEQFLQRVTEFFRNEGKMIDSLIQLVARLGRAPRSR
jgi:hypothetical protein